MDKMEKEAKEALFRELYRLDEDSSQEDRSNASVILRESRLAPLSSDVSASIGKDEAIHSLRREPSLLPTVLAPVPQPSASNPRQADVVNKSSFSSNSSSNSSKQVIIDTPIVQKKFTSMPARKNTPKAIGKRKRGQSIELKPESQQIFKGLGFCRPEQS